MRPIFATSLRMVIAFITGLLISILGNYPTNWPCGLAELLALLLGMLGILRVGEKNRSLAFAWLSTSYLVWFGFELPILLHPQLLILTTSGCFVGCDPGVVYPDEYDPANFVIVLIGFLIGLLALLIVILTVTEIIKGFREAWARKQ